MAVRCSSASIMLSHRLRADADVALVAGDRVSAFFNTPRLRNVRPDESSLMGILRKAFKSMETGAAGLVHSGVIIYRRGVKHYLTGFAIKCYCCHRGTDLRSLLTRGGSVAIVVPLTQLANSLVSAIESMRAVPLKCPVDRLWPDQVITLLNILMDRWCTRASG
ncbi:MAG: hypothetical protein DRJ57_00425 [Thermoprotei archaeon]|nr:MAG: hypothetical protein DRJ57_00425 [Thermoprotei archaeon]